MSFTEAIKSVFTKYATFTGRARRSEFWYFFLFNFLVSGVLSLLVEVTDGGAFVKFLSGVWSLGTLIPGLAVAWRRMHDIGRSGANWFWNFLPIVGNIIYIVRAATDGVRGPNQYGPDPKGSSFGDGEKAPWEY